MNTYQNINSPAPSSSPPPSSSEAKEMTQKRRLFSLAIAVSMFTLTVAGLCLLRGMEDILADQSSKPTLLSSDMHVGKDNKSSKSKLHRHLVKKEMDKKSAADAQDNGAVPAKAQFKDFISSPFSLFIPFFTTYYTTSSSDKDAKSLAAPTDDEWNPFVVALSNVTVDPLSNGTLTIIDFEDDDNATAIDDEMQESLFEEAAESNFLTSPDGKSYQVKANLPGVEKEDISAKTMNDMLYVTASKGDETEPSFYSISRAMRLPEDSDKNRISAVYNKEGTGALQLDIPKVYNTPAGASLELNKQAKDIKSTFNDDKVRKIEIQ